MKHLGQKQLYKQWSINETKTIQNGREGKVYISLFTRMHSETHHQL